MLVGQGTVAQVRRIGTANVRGTHTDVESRRAAKLRFLPRPL